MRLYQIKYGCWPVLHLDAPDLNTIAWNFPVLLEILILHKFDLIVEHAETIGVSFIFVLIRCFDPSL